MNSDTISGFLTRRTFLLIGGILLMVFILRAAPVIWSKSQINLFSINLARAWTGDIFSPDEEICSADIDQSRLRRMHIYLTRGSNHNANGSFHQGSLACLEGDRLKAKKIWLNNDDNFAAPVSSLFAAVTTFVEGGMIQTPFMLEFADYGYNRCVRADEGQEIVRAIGWCEFSLTYHPNEQTALQLDSLYGQLDDENARKEVWLKLKEAVSSESAEHWIAQAKIANLDGDYESAAIAFQRAAQLSDRDRASDYYLNAGSMWFQLHEFDQTEAAYLKAVELHPQKLVPFITLGNFYRLQDRFARAARWYKEALNRFPDHPQPPFYLGLVAREQGNYQEALTYFDRSLALREDSPQTLYARALTLQAMERQEEAILTLQMAISSHNNPPEDWTALLREWRKS